MKMSVMYSLRSQVSGTRTDEIHRQGSYLMYSGDSEWTKKGGTLSDKSAQKEFELARV